MSPATTPFAFDDGAAYERLMGVWSRLAGEVFLDWLAPAPGLRWVDVGCGNGAFTEAIQRRCGPAELLGLDPSGGQLAFARARPGARGALFVRGDAMALPLPAGRFDAAVMALVIFFLPDPARGVAEMARVVRPGGLVASYAWDMAGGGFPLDPVHQALRALGREPARPPSLDASRMEALQALWEGAGLEAVETREIAVRRGFGSFEEFWYAAMSGAGLRNAVAAMTQAEVGRLRQEVRARLPPESAGRILCGARANAIKGRVPA